MPSCCLFQEAKKHFCLHLPKRYRINTDCMLNTSLSHHISVTGPVFFPNHTCLHFIITFSRQYLQYVGKKGCCQSLDTTYIIILCKNITANGALSCLDFLPPTKENWTVTVKDGPMNCVLLTLWQQFGKDIDVMTKIWSYSVCITGVSVLQCRHFTAMVRGKSQYESYCLTFIPW